MRKLEASKVGGVQREGKKPLFVSWKAYFSSGYFSITPFPLHFEDDF
jgi:hypothetical protein